MAQFVAFEKDIEVNGQTILSVVKGAGVFEATARKYLARNGLDNVEERSDTWYSQQGWLDTFKELQSTVGKNTVYLIGKKIPETAVFPPEIRSIEDALASIDVAYHLNHRREGRVMFEPVTKRMLEGIGHYEFKLERPGKAVMVCMNPYPCAFDRGIIQTMASRFSDTAVVKHNDSTPCRDKGFGSCTYEITW